MTSSIAGLPGRAAFVAALESALARHRGSGRKLAVIFVGLDRFKGVNDALGPGVGDLLLAQAAQRLSRASVACAGGPVARVGGDLFALLVPEFRVVSELRFAATRLLEALRGPFHVGPNEIRIAASAGLAMAPSDGEEAALVLRGAGAALNRAKADGGRCYRFFAAAMGDDALRRLALESQLACAWERGEFVLHYQPIVCLATGRTTGVEALLRWAHPLRGIVAAGAFIESAEAIGLTDTMQSWTLEAACRQVAAWDREGHGPLEVSVNVTTRPFGDGHLAPIVARALAASRLAASRLELEITETAFLRSAARTERTLESLDALGVRLALDDFGTGYSSLAYLRRLPVDRVKIDRGFLAGLGEEARAEPVIAAIVALAHGLGLAAVAEGVESDTQLSALRGLGCDAAQGFLFAPALSPEQVPEALWRIAQSPRLREPSRAASSTALRTPIFSNTRAR